MNRTLHTLSTLIIALLVLQVAFAANFHTLSWIQTDAQGNYCDPSNPATAYSIQNGASWNYCAYVVPLAGESYTITTRVTNQATAAVKTATQTITNGAQFPEVTVGSSLYSGPGVYVVQVTIDGAQTAAQSKAITLTVLGTVVPPVNHAPVLDPIGNKAMNEGATLSITALANDADGDVLTYSASGVPTFGTFNAGTHTLTLTPDFTQSGSYNITFSVSDGKTGGVDSETITLTVNDVVPNTNIAPVINPINDFTLVEGHTMANLQVVASDSNGDALTFSPVVGTLPAGLSFNVATGILSGIPAVGSSGTYPLLFTVTDTQGATDTETATIMVVPNSVPVLNPISSIVMNEGDVRTAQVVAADANGDSLSYGLVAPFPSFATINPVTGMITFNPGYADANNYTLTVIVTDGISSTQTSFVLVVNDAMNPSNNAPVLSIIGNRAVYEGQVLSFQVVATDSDNDPLSFGTTALQSFMTFDPVTQTFTAAPLVGDAGVYQVTFIVNDGMASDSETINITVIQQPVSQQITVQNISCLDPVVEFGLQACQITTDVGGANVILHEVSTGNAIGACTTDAQTGTCSVNFNVGTQGTMSVYATASRTGYVADSDTTPVETFTIIGQAPNYRIASLDTYNDSAFTQVDHDFFRSQIMYVSFMVNDNGVPVTGAVTEVMLTTQLGGQISATESAPSANGRYFYALTIPVGSEYLGSSHVFSFVFQSNTSADQLQIQVNLLNNPPVIDPAIDTLFVSGFNASQTLDVGLFESDVEDNDAQLFWTLSNPNPSLFTASIATGTDLLTINTIATGNASITLFLNDKDGAQVFRTISFSTQVAQQTQCADGVDNDHDGLVDMFDPDCTSSFDNTEAPSAVLQCQDGMDNDGDGYIDMADADCSSAQDNTESGSSQTQCSDGMDNDIDGLADMLDPDCSSLSDTTESGTMGRTQCQDGVDNDQDGLVDMADSDCSSLSDTTESPTGVVAQCADGVDNDHDGLTDYPADLGCSAAQDTDETNPLTLPQCHDGMDNDGDGFTDIHDADCETFNDTNESTVLPTPVPTTGMKGGHADLMVLGIIFVRESSSSFDIAVNLENDLGIDLQDLSLVVYLDEQGWMKSSKFDLDDGDQTTKKVHFDNTKVLTPGRYSVEIVAQNDDVRVVKWRDIVVEG